jgi:hypothetical protein
VKFSVVISIEKTHIKTETLVFERTANSFEELFDELKSEVNEVKWNWMSIYSIEGKIIKDYINKQSKNYIQIYGTTKFTKRG